MPISVSVWVRALIVDVCPETPVMYSRRCIVVAEVEVSVSIESIDRRRTSETEEAIAMAPVLMKTLLFSEITVHWKPRDLMLCFRDLDDSGVDAPHRMGKFAEPQMWNSGAARISSFCPYTRHRL